MDDTYEFRREDNDEIIEVDLATMLDMDIAGFIVKEIDGEQVVCRRVRTGNDRKKPCESRLPTHQTHVSDTLGFTEHQFETFEQHRRENNFSGVEFKRDPEVPQFFQVHVDGPAELERYRKSRGFFDKNSRNGGRTPLSPRDLEHAEELMKKKYPRRNEA